MLPAARWGCKLPLMGRPLLIILILATLLACPLRCLSCQTATVEVGDDAAAACCCCHDTGHGDEIPTDGPSPRDSCVCPSCLCEGATIPNGPSIPRIDFTVALEAWAVPADQLLSGGTTSPQVSIDDRPLCFLGGRDALVAYQSWLI